MHWAPVASDTGRGNRGRRLAAWLPLALLSGLLSCESGSRERVFVNSGAVCLRASQDTLRAEVKWLGCLSSSCNREVANACSITQSGGLITISSRLVIEPNGANCATTCSSWTTRCEMPTPSAGSYDVAFGAARGSLVFPLEMATELLADGSTRGCAPEETELGVSPQM